MESLRELVLLACGGKGSWMIRRDFTDHHLANSARRASPFHVVSAQLCKRSIGGEEPAGKTCNLPRFHIVHRPGNLARETVSSSNVCLGVFWGVFPLD
jgi:hypothetical protein